MIERLEERKVYNPIREHISIAFEMANEEDEIPLIIAGDLKEKKFDPHKSRVLVFVPTRKKAETVTETLKEELEELELSFADKIDFYHAGLEGVEREEKYDQYNSGETVILVATKAFGMGMDIKNIHFIYHVGPSSTFEDYLQEVGRAGRNKEMLHAAGFSDDNPIQTKCLITKNDFKKLKDKLHESQMTWNHLDQVRKAVFEYFSRFKELKPDEENAFPLPLDLLSQNPDFEEIKNIDTFFRVALYWLEKLKRINLGVYTPTHLPIRLLQSEKEGSSFANREEHEVVEKFVAGLRAYQEKKFSGSDTIMIETGTLRKLIQNSNPVNIFSILFKAQKAKLLVVEREITLEPTKTRIQELKEWKHANTSPIIEATFDMAEELLNQTRLGDQGSLDGAHLDDLVKAICNDHFMPASIFWKETKGKKDIKKSSDEIAELQQMDFVTKRAKFALKLIGFLPNLRHKSVIEVEPDSNNPTITQLIYNGCKDHQEWKSELQLYKESLYRLIRYVSEVFIKKGSKKFNIIDLYLKLDMHEIEDEFFQKIVFLAKSLAYLKGSGGLIPMGVELYIQNTEDFSEKDQASNDHLVFQEFRESIQMKELRLMTLECLSEIPKEKYDGYIKDYFRAATIKDIISLLEENIGEDHENLKAFRTEALNKAKDALSEEQLKVYDAPIDKNIQVIAGPGSGKTHTLTLRVARLIQEEKINPENIVVLAYNRAVVVELKERLGKLFRELGYGKLINRLNVFTFHGYCKRNLSEDLNDMKLEDWTSVFIDKIRSEPGLVNQKLGNIKYVFVDEFQDITTERLKLLELIANPKQTRVCVIGDPNQSIYGYQRADAGDPMDPRPFYERFDDIYAPLELNLANNYRSYPMILEKAEELLSRNKSKFPMPQLKAIRVPETADEYCSIIIHKSGDPVWNVRLKELIDHKDETGKKQYAQIAIMFRSNDEVFKAHNTLQKENLQNVRIRIQGGKASPYRTREFHYFIECFREKLNQVIGNDFIDYFKKIKSSAISTYNNWDQYLINLAHCCILEFEKVKEENDTYEDLIDFLFDLANKDDGQLGKIYQNNIHRIDDNESEQEIIITTMHKVKGIEFDAVLIPPSFSSLPIIDNDDSLLSDTIEEERRLYYVAYSRAKYRLVAIKYRRELHLDDGLEFMFPNKVINDLGIPMPSGMDKLYISWGASAYNAYSFNFIKKNIKIGDEVILRKEQRPGYTNWNICVKGSTVGRLRGVKKFNDKEYTKLREKLDQYNAFNGFAVSSVERYTYNETLEYDKKHDATFSTNWSEEAKERGYIYLVDFSGYGKPQE